MDEQKKEKKHKRIGSIDVVKGITIFLVIIGHAAGNTEAPFYRVVLYAFHMPLFFFISGMLFNSKGKTFGAFIKKKAQSLICPYVLFYVLAILFYLLSSRIGAARISSFLTRRSFVARAASSLSVPIRSIAAPRRSLA